jgi:hypothetical protein
MSVKVTDLTEGEMVIVSGNTGADGTVTARSLQVAPAGRFNFEGGSAPVPQGSQAQGDTRPGDAPPAP